MTIAICPRCNKNYDTSKYSMCPDCGKENTDEEVFRNSDRYLKEQSPLVVEERKKAGLDGLVGGLEAIIINTEVDRHEGAAKELLRYTGYDWIGSFMDEQFATSVLSRKESADILIRSRLQKKNPFHKFNLNPKSEHLPNTRLETFVFRTGNIEPYVEIQRARGVQFLTEDIVRNSSYSFIQTKPSEYSGISIGIIQWHDEPGNYNTHKSELMKIELYKPDRSYLNNIHFLDHTATRVRAQDRDAAILEFLKLTNYDFQFAIYVQEFNSITSVARLSAKDFAMVFTAGITPYNDQEDSGPTEKFIYNFGTRVHHMAFVTENIENTFKAIKDDGMQFLIELVGSPEDGLKQTFSETSEHTLLVSEYIHRYGGFDGFFTKSNVTLLTEATDKQ